MAHLLFGADLSLGPSDRRGHDHPDAKSGVPVIGNVAVEDTGTWPHCTQALAGKKNHPADFVDYLGASSILETDFGAPLPPAPSYVSRNSANIPESLSTRLTLFYAGAANAFDNVTKDKVSEDGHAQDFTSLLVPCQAIVPKALPLARKASLARFLEKRKERVRLMAPYLGKGSPREIIHQAANHSNASTLHMFYNEFWGNPSAKKLGCASRFVYGNNVHVEDHNWFTIAEASKQASECESAT